MRHRWGALALAAWLPLAVSAESTGTDIDVQLQGDTLVLEFPQAMQVLRNARRHDLVRLTPAIATTCSWSSDTELACTLEKTARQATRYRVALVGGLVTAAGKPLPPATLTVDTARPRLSVGLLRWDGATPVYEVSSDAKVTPESIAAVLRLRLGDRPVPVELRPLPARYAWQRNYARFALPLPQVREQQTVALSVVPGLRSTEGALTGRQSEPLALAIAGEPFQLRGAVCAGMAAPRLAAVRDGRLGLDACAPGEPMRLMFSREPAEAARKAWIAGWPAGARLLRSGREDEWRTRGDLRNGVPARAPGWWVEFTVDAAHAQVALDIPALPAMDDAALSLPVAARVSTVSPRPALRARFARALLSDPNQARVDVVNAAPREVDVIALAARPARATLATPAAGDTPHDIVPGLARAALAQGGLVRIDPDGSGNGGLAQLAAPDFDVFASAGPGEVLVWAMSWDGATPVDSADVELLARMPGASPQVVTRGRTARDGTALLALPAAFRADKARRPEWLVRVQSGARRGAARAVLPLDVPTYSSVLEGAIPQRRTWGVTDRPLYRAGDTVRWRTWVREMRDGALVSPPEATALALALEGIDGKLLHWRAPLDAMGAASGETRIPIHAPDGTYCLTLDENYGRDVVCFHVGTYRAQDLWLRASADDRVLREGDALAFDVEAGYYSGGSAAGVEVSRVQAQLREADPGEAYPAYADYAFVRTEGAVPRVVKGIDALHLQADGDGRARATLPMDFEDAGDAPLPAFGRVRVSAEAKLSDRESTTSNMVELRYARFDRYVGLRVDPAWFDAISPIRMRGVVIDAQGREIGGAAIDVEVQYQTPDGSPVSLRHCTLVAGQDSDCSFPRKDRGIYRVIARSGNAAPATIERYVWAGHGWHGGQGRESTLEAVGAPGARGAPVKLLLGQPSAPAQVLLVTRWGGMVLDRRVVRVDAASQAIELPTSARWPHRVRVTAYVRGQPEADAVPAGYRPPVKVAEVSTELRFDLATPAQRPVEIAFAETRAAPADIVQLRLHNNAGAPRSVTLAVVDDALRALGARHVEEMNPAEWLGASPPWSSTRNAGFGDWNGTPWRWVFPSAKDAERCMRGRDGDARAACQRARRGSEGGINPIDVSSVESTTILTAERAGGLLGYDRSTSVALLAPGVVTGNDAATLDSVTVAGETLADAASGPAAAAAPPVEPPVVFDEPSPVDVPGVKPDTGSKAPARPETTDTPEQDALALARVRTRFADTALWRTDIVLAPGETRVLDVAVPDNLTRWRAIAWSNDAGDDFAMTDAVLEAGLPVEARLQAPVRVYPGDRTRIATNVRQAADHPSQATAMLRVQGRGHASSTHSATLALPAAGQASFGVELAPDRAGDLLLTAAAATPEGRDALASRLEVASPTIPAFRTQAGWIGDAPLSLALPVLPAGASQPRLDVSIWRGNTALVHAWTEALREYPHRCWEQILSRAIGAALAIERGDSAWPGAEGVVKEALDNAAVFQGDDGAMRYFAAPPAFQGGFERRPNIALTAYTVDAFALLRELGYPVPTDVEADARKLLASGDWADTDDEADEPVDEHAFAASVGAARAGVLDVLWGSRQALSLPGRIATARALALAAHPRAADAFAALLDAAPLHGEARVVRGDDSAWSRWMGSRKREQCALIRLYGDYPQLAPAGARLALQAGLSDLYAGGVADVDTQTGATCLVALREPKGGAQQPVTVDARVGTHDERIVLPADAQQSAASFPALAGGSLSLSAMTPPDAPIAYLARVGYLEDARRAQSTAVGFALERRYAVLRAHRWLPLTGVTLQEGDWVRITLVVSNTREREFVAVSDDLPGGLRPMDLSLAGVAGVDVQALADEGDWAFDQRRLDARKPKFYAEHLWPGRHEIHYFARAANTGDYLAAPAEAELMYGDTTRARTAAMRVHVREPAARAKP